MLGVHSIVLQWSTQSERHGSGYTRPDFTTYLRQTERDDYGYTAFMQRSLFFPAEAVRADKVSLFVTDLLA